MERQYDAAGTQTNVLCLSCERRRDDRRVGRKPSERVEMSLRNPDCLEAVTIGELRALDEQIVLVSVEGCLVVAEEREAEPDSLVGTWPWYSRRYSRGRACLLHSGGRVD